MPCLNEAETIGRCVDRARQSIAGLDVRGEVLVADNGSTDGSQQIALAHGAKVVMVDEPGYGAAIRGGVAASSGRYIIMGDADESYDFGEIPPILERLRVGDDLVMGNRFAGGIDKGAMPWSHRWIGNPVLSMTGRIFFSKKSRPSLVGRGSADLGAAFGDLFGEMFNMGGSRRASRVQRGRVSQNAPQHDRHGVCK